MNERHQPFGRIGRAMRFGLAPLDERQLLSEEEMLSRYCDAGVGWRAGQTDSGPPAPGLAGSNGSGEGLNQQLLSKACRHTDRQASGRMEGGSLLGRDVRHLD